MVIPTPPDHSGSRLNSSLLPYGHSGAWKCTTPKGSTHWSSCHVFSWSQDTIWFTIMYPNINNDISREKELLLLLQQIGMETGESSEIISMLFSAMLWNIATVNWKDYSHHTLECTSDFTINNKANGFHIIINTFQVHSNSRSGGPRSFREERLDQK